MPRLHGCWAKRFPRGFRPEIYVGLQVHFYTQMDNQDEGKIDRQIGRCGWDFPKDLKLA